MATEWYCRIDGTDFGPFEAADLKRMTSSGRLGPTDLVRKQDGKWVQANTVKGLSFAVPATSPEPPPAKVDASVKPCPACKSSGPATRVLCIDCGYDFRTGKRRVRAGQKTGSKTMLLVAGGAGVILLVAGVIVYLVAFNRGTERTGPAVAQRPASAGRHVEKVPLPSNPGPDVTGKSHSGDAPAMPPDQPPILVPNAKSKAPDSVAKLLTEVKDASQFANREVDALSLLLRQGELAGVLEGVQNDGGEGYVVPELLKLIDERQVSRNRVDLLVVNQAVFVLGELGPKAQEAVPALKGLLNHQERLVSGQASFALEVMNGTKESWAQKKKRRKG